MCPSSTPTCWPGWVYTARRTQQGLSKKDIIRCLKRSIAREIYHALRNDLKDLALAA